MSGPSSRMLTLLSLLQVHRDWPGDELAGRLEVSPRTLRRDVDRLRGLGYRIEALRGPAGGYRLAAGADLPPLLFDDDQAVAIAVALAVAPASGADIAEGAARALVTIRQVLPERLRHRVGAVDVVTTAARTAVDPDVLVEVSRAVSAHEVLRFGYGPDEHPRRVEPHAVVARSGRWYLLAWDLERSDWRTFRVDRISPRPPTRLRFTPRRVPGDDPATFVAGRSKGSAAEDVWPCVGTVELACAASDVQPYVDAADDLVETGPDRCRLTTGSWSWDALAARVAGFAVPFAVLQPPALRAATAALADRLRDASR